MRSIKIIIICFLFLSAGSFAQAYYNPGKPAGFVNDYAGMLSVEQKSSLENKLNQFSIDSSNEISVVTIPSLKGDTIDNFAVKLFQDWGIGKTKKDNGVLLLISLSDRKMRIEVGYGLEGALPDATSFRIITDDLTPAFKTGNYYEGINKATDKIILATKGEYKPDPNATKKTPLKSLFSNGDAFYFIIIFGFWILSALRIRLAKSKAWWEGGVIGVAAGIIIAFIFFRTILGFSLWVIILGGAGLLFDYLVSRILPPPTKGGHGGAGIWFLGGGGGSGGGGSSGGW